MATFNLLGVLTSLLFAGDANFSAAIQSDPAPKLSLSMVGEEAIVMKPIKPFQAGQVRCHGIFWMARSLGNQETLNPGDRVNIVGQENITLLVEPLPKQ